MAARSNRQIQMYVSIVLMMFASLATECAALPQASDSASRAEMNLGVQAYKNNHYAEAVEHFKTAVLLDPANQNAQLYLATSYMIQWVPGADSPENKMNLELARQEFEKVLEKDRTNALALSSMASLAYNAAATGTPEEKAAALEEAKKWNQRRIDADPKDADAHYYLGVIAWAQAFTPIQTERVRSGMKASDPGPLKDSMARQDLNAKYQRTIEDGMQALKKCLETDKENEDAMSYMNLLLRKKADLEDSPEAARADVTEAEEWSNKSLELKKIKAGRPPK
jgi:tetratricopeptide (TPR) repeat protein